MDWIVTGIIAAIAVALAAQRSSYLVDYVVIVYVFNRGLRRVLDYYAGSFNPFSPVSLTPSARHRTHDATFPGALRYVAEDR